MIKYSFQNKKNKTHNIFFVYINEDNYLSKILKINPSLKDIVQQRSFTGKKGSVLDISILNQKQYQRFILFGIGQKKEINPSEARSLGAQSIKIIKKINNNHVLILGISERLKNNFQYLIEGFELGYYQFNKFKSKQSLKNNKHQDKEIIFADLKTEDYRNIVNKAKIISKAICYTKDLVNTPSMQLGINQIVKESKKIAQASQLINCQILDHKMMKKMGMEASLAVGQGSNQKPCLVHLTYKPKNNPQSKKIALIGKGITFDSGGLSIKPAEGMIDMKIDMAGAATVMGVFQSLSKLKIDTEVHGVFILAENMINGNAYRPGDVVRAMNGKTIEVINTDAEGRLTLADALVYAETKIKPDEIIDLATLTGASIIALGYDFIVLLSQNKTIKNKINKASLISGDYIWELPLHQGYKKMLRSNIADIKNLGGKSAGTITAGLFLENFINKTPWAHLDIAGASYNDRQSKIEWGTGATGRGVGLLINYLLNE